MRIPTDEQVLKQHLGLDRSTAAIKQSIEGSLNAASEGSMFGSSGLCPGYPVRPMPEHYFVAQEFNTSRDDLRYALSDALDHLGVKPICADDSVGWGHILCKTSSLIQSTPFGVYQLTTSQNRNVYLELGIAIGLGRPFILVKDKNARISSLASGLEYFPIDSYLELSSGLGPKVENLFASAAQYERPALPPAGSLSTAFISHGDLDTLDFSYTVGKAIAGLGLLPVFPGDPEGKLSKFLTDRSLDHRILGIHGQIQLDETVAALQTARFGIYRIDKAAGPDSFLCLGMSLGLNRPGLLLHREGQEVPADVQGIGARRFNSFTDLGGSHGEALSSLLKVFL
ncbi:MAG TPA: hypothetical protein VN643_07660 [Pyrinomonadaceae bacterium]|nr:hypothetical protein [Pyrinomonadaceae bacterium]